MNKNTSGTALHSFSYIFSSMLAITVIFAAARFFSAKFFLTYKKIVGFSHAYKAKMLFTDIIPFALLLAAVFLSQYFLSAHYFQGLPKKNRDLLAKVSIVVCTVFYIKISPHTSMSCYLFSFPLIFFHIIATYSAVFNN